MLFNLDIAKNNILLCFFVFFLIIDLYFLIPAVTAKIWNPLVELVISIEKPIKEASIEIGIYPLIVEGKIGEHLLIFALTANKRNN